MIKEIKNHIDHIRKLRHGKGYLIEYIKGDDLKKIIKHSDTSDIFYIKDGRYYFNVMFYNNGKFIDISLSTWQTKISMI